MYFDCLEMLSTPYMWATNEGAAFILRVMGRLGRWNADEGREKWRNELAAKVKIELSRV